MKVQVESPADLTRHVLHAKQFTRSFLEHELFPEALRVRMALRNPKLKEALRQELRHRILLTHFYEPSTRTRLSFEFAALLLGMHVLSTENASDFSSAIKGESEEDSIRILSSYGADAIVIRHKQTGIVDRMAELSRVPVINGGDGTGQHPTQALLDLYTIYDERRGLRPMTVTFGGDLKHGRTVRSLVYLLSKYAGIRMLFVSHESFRIGQDIKDHLKENSVEFAELDSVETALGQASVVYWTRTQIERIEDEDLRAKLVAESDKICAQFTIGPKQMSWMKPNTTLMHPLPRVWEIEHVVDKDPRAAYFRQAENGLFIRMALLKWITVGI